MLKSHVSSNSVEVQVRNHQSAQLFTEVLMRRRAADISSMPLLEEWISALILMFLFQKARKSLSILPYGFVPESKEFDSLVGDCTLPDIKAKFRALKTLPPRSLRSEIGSAARLVNATFRSPHFLLRCDGEFDIDAFVKAHGKLIVERGEDVDDDATTTILSSRTLSFIDYAKVRSKPYPPICVFLDEATTGKIAGKIEEKAAAETRKYGLFFYVICQYPNFPGGTDGYFQNFPRKEIYRTADRDLAKKMAAIIASENPSYEISRASHVEYLTSQIMTLKTGYRFVTGPGGSGGYPEYVKPLASPWPDWPGLREAKLKEKLECIYRRIEYQKRDDLTSDNSSKTETPPRGKSPGDSSPALRWKRHVKGQTDSSAKNENEREPMSED